MNLKKTLIADFRSDTLTKPSPEMLNAMFSAKVGDDVFGEDPTVNELQSMAAQMFGKEAALFCASGTMTNQIAIKVHTVPGDELICSDFAHIYRSEGGGIAFNSGVSARLISGNRGRLSLNDIKRNVNPDDIHCPRTTLVALENTQNKGGGCFYDFEEIKRIAAFCKEKSLKLHLDGARLFNALVETGETPLQYGECFDSISICLSKGLGTPVGSLLLGSNSFINQAKRVRKVFGGAMRQAGFLAAAGIYALNHNIERLKIDHQRAKQIGEVLEKVSFVKEILPVETNIIIFRVKDEVEPQNIVELLKQNNILALQFGEQQIRMVLHLDITDEMVQYTIEKLRSL